MQNSEIKGNTLCKFNFYPKVSGFAQLLNLISKGKKIDKIGSKPSIITVIKSIFLYGLRIVYETTSRPELDNVKHMYKVPILNVDLKLVI